MSNLNPGIRAVRQVSTVTVIPGSRNVIVEWLANADASPMVAHSCVLVADGVVAICGLPVVTQERANVLVWTAARHVGRIPLCRTCMELVRRNMEQEASPPKLAKAKRKARKRR